MDWDRYPSLLHHAIIFQIDGSSYRLRRHADLLPSTSGPARGQRLLNPDGVDAHTKMEAPSKPPENPNRILEIFTLPIPGIFTVPLIAAWQPPSRRMALKGRYVGHWGTASFRIAHWDSGRPGS